MSGACCMAWCGLSFACNHMLIWTLGCQEHLFQSCIFYSYNLIFFHQLFEKGKWVFFLLWCSFFPDVSSSPGLRSPHETWPQFPSNRDFCPNSSWVQQAGCTSWGWADAADRTHTAWGGNLPDIHLPSFTGQTGTISSPASSFMRLNFTTYVKAFVSLADLFLLSFQP